MEAGVVEHIHLAETTGAPIYAVSSVEAVAGEGLVGDRTYGQATAKGRAGEGLDLTLVEAEMVEALLTDAGIELAPGEVRRQLTTRGVALNDLVGRQFRVGQVVLRGVRSCDPCALLERRTRPGARAVLEHRAGVRADVVTGGTIRTNDAVAAVTYDSESAARMLTR